MFLRLPNSHKIPAPSFEQNVVCTALRRMVAPTPHFVANFAFLLCKNTNNKFTTIMSNPFAGICAPFCHNCKKAWWEQRTFGATKRNFKLFLGDRRKNHVPTSHYPLPLPTRPWSTQHDLDVAREQFPKVRDRRFRNEDWGCLHWHTYEAQSEDWIKVHDHLQPDSVGPCGLEWPRRESAELDRTRLLLCCSFPFNAKKEKHLLRKKKQSLDSLNVVGRQLVHQWRPSEI